MPVVLPVVLPVVPEVVESVEAVEVPVVPLVPLVLEELEVLELLSAVWSASNRLCKSSASFETPDAADGDSGGGPGGGGGGADPVGGASAVDGVVPEAAVPVDAVWAVEELAARRRAWRRSQVIDPPELVPLDSMDMVLILSRGAVRGITATSPDLR